MATHAEYRKKMLETTEKQSVELAAIGRVQRAAEVARAEYRQIERQKHREVIGMMRLMALGILGVLIVAVFATVGIVWGGETSFNGGVNGYYRWIDEKNVNQFGYNVGIQYSPDIMQTEITKAGLVQVVASSPLSFWTNQVIDTDGSQTNISGLGYMFSDLREHIGIQLIWDAGASFHYKGENVYTVGWLTGLRCPFAVASQNYRAMLQGGNDGDNWVMLVGINFATK